MICCKCLLVPCSRLPPHYVGSIVLSAVSCHHRCRFCFNCMHLDAMSLQGECSPCYNGIMSCGCLSVLSSVHSLHCVGYTLSCTCLHYLHDVACKLSLRNKSATLCWVSLPLVPTQPCAIPTGTSLSVSSPMTAAMH